MIDLSDRPASPSRARFPPALRIATIYGVAAIAWILLTDYAVESLWGTQPWHPVVQSLKGVLFVLLSAVLIYVLVRREQRRREEASREISESERLLESTFRSLDDALFVVRLPERTIALANPAVKETFGHAPEELRGSSTRLLYPSEESWRRFDREGLPALEARGVFRTEWELRRADGSVFPAMVTVSLVTDDDGERVGAVSVVWDISERKARERELRETRDLLDGVFESLEDGLFLVDVEDRTFITCNRAAERMTGYTREELEGRSTRLVYASDAYFEEVGREIEARRGSGDAYRMEARMKRRDGTTFPIEGVVSMLEPENGEAGVEIAVTRDISERKALEEELRASRDRLQRYALRLQTVREDERHVVARDLHDELGGSLTALGMLLARIRPVLPDDEETEALVEEMEALAGNALDDVRRISAELRPPVLDELGLAAALEDLVSETHDRSELDLRFEGFGRVGALDLDADRAVQLYRIAQEALTNVLRHARARTCTVRLTEDASEIRLSVEDDGVGVDPEEAFGHMKGTGMVGMRERARSLGGTLLVRPRKGGGTCVIAAIPLERAAGSGGNEVAPTEGPPEAVP